MSKRYKFSHEELDRFEEAIKGLQISKCDEKKVYTIIGFTRGYASVSNDYHAGAGHFSVYVDMSCNTQPYQRMPIILKLNKAFAENVRYAKVGMFELQFDGSMEACIVPVGVGKQLLNEI